MTLRITSNLGTLFNKNWKIPYTKTFIKNVESVQREGIREFLRVAIPLVPVLTGTAKASLMKLALSVHKDIEVFQKETRSGRGPFVGIGMQHYDWGYKGNGLFIFEASL